MDTIKSEDAVVQEQPPPDIYSRPVLQEQPPPDIYNVPVVNQPPPQTTYRPDIAEELPPYQHQYVHFSLSPGQQICGRIRKDHAWFRMEKWRRCLHNLQAEIRAGEVEH